MVFFKSAEWFISDRCLGMDGSYSKYLRLHWDDRQFHHYWLIDKCGIRLPNVGKKYLVSARTIEHFAVVKHHAWYTLLFFCDRLLRGLHPARFPAFPGKIDRYVYSTLGTTFDSRTTEIMIQGIKILELKLLEFTWPEFLEHNQLVQATRLRESARLHVAGHDLASAVR